jgi:hypothetical protein
MLAPTPAEPFHVFDYRLNVFLFFFGRVGIVKPKIALAPEFSRYAEIQTNTLRVADVQVAIGFGRKSGYDLPAPFAAFAIFRYYLPNEVESVLTIIVIFQS